MSAAMDALSTLLDSMDVIGKLQTFSVLTATFNGIMLWELVTCFPAEAKYIFMPELKECISRRKLPSLGSVLLFNARLLVIPIVGISFQMIAPGGGMGMSMDFNTLFRAYVFLFSATVFNGTAVFVIRTLAIRDSGRPMTIFLWCCYFIVCIFHLICAGLVKMPTDFLTYGTLPSPTDQYLPWVVFVACAVAFDILVLALSLAPQLEGLKWKPTYSHIAKRFYFDAIMYFGFSLVVATFDFIWVLSHQSDGLLVALAVPIHIWLMVAISPRVIRNLRLHAAKQKTGATPELSKERSPFSAGIDSLPHTAYSGSQVGHTPSSVFVITKERTTLYPSSLYSDPSRS